MVSVADIHLCNDDGYGIYEAGGVNDFLLLKYNAALSSVKYAIDNDCIYTFLGDLINSRTAEAQTMFYASMLMKWVAMCRYAIIISGNHDVNDRKAFFSMISHWRHLLPDHVQIVTQPTICTFEGIDFYCVPSGDNFPEYFSSSMSKLIASNTDSKNKKIILSHGPIKGAKLDGGLASKSGVSESFIERMSNAFDYIIFGDYHRHQKFCSNGWYTGSIIQTSLRDIDQKKGFQVVDIDKGTVKFVRTKGPEFVKIDMEVKSWKDLNLDMDVERIKGKYVVLNITSSDAQSKRPSNKDVIDKLMSLGAFRASVDISTTNKVKRTKVISGASSPNEWVQMYVDMQTKDLPADKNRLIERGLSYMR